LRDFKVGADIFEQVDIIWYKGFIDVDYVGDVDTKKYFWVSVHIIWYCDLYE